MSVDPIPEGYHTVTPYLSVHDAAAALDFYGRAFGATELERVPGPDGTIAHAAVAIGDGRIMLCDPSAQGPAKPPKELGGTTATVFLYVEDADAAYQHALAAGATGNMPPEDTYWGARFAQVADPFGHVWHIATQKEDVSVDEMVRRSEHATTDIS